ncbi:hypothetical protein H3H54_15635 [Brachybacterium sp. Z12]|uniref:hypothetical protein n=1 Tax=Brachybacterium sp. Z12 TaxID=2759167 RepID=UPI001862B529|nr:hypothetical protein [Brachybacterium sp. Z12]QNN82409.1 hypothetical protein H3H54_15635 [Brachybacterium sp. Z12]
MRNATISTSRTRATTDHLIDYRPLPESFGDRESLQALRAAKARAADRGLDPSTLELRTVPARPSHRAPARRAGGRGLLSSLLREPGVPRRRRDGRESLATA